MEITTCHEDAQFARDNGAVLHYVATYALKFSDSMDKDWLNDHASDYSVARRMLFSHHPGEPEMSLTLAAEHFPQVDYKGSLVDIFVPLPDCTNDKKPKWLVNYEESAWRKDNIPLIEFLRRATKTATSFGTSRRHTTGMCARKWKLHCLRQGAPRKTPRTQPQKCLGHTKDVSGKAPKKRLRP